MFEIIGVHGPTGANKNRTRNKRENAQHKRTKGTIWFYPNGKGLQMICLAYRVATIAKL